MPTNNGCIKSVGWELFIFGLSKSDVDRSNADIGMENELDKFATISKAVKSKCCEASKTQWIILSF